MSDELTPLIRDLISPEVRFNMRIFHALEGMMGSQLAGTIPFGELRQFAEAFLAAGDDGRTPQEAAQPEEPASTRLRNFLTMVRRWVEREGGDMDAAIAWMYADHAPSPSSLSQEDRELMERAYSALIRARKHHGTTSLPMAVQNYGSREACGTEGKAVWAEEVPAAIDALRTRLSQSPEGRKG